jgi:choline-sulfatase
MDKCALIDRWIGLLVNVLEERSFLENTVIIFSSDHGDNLGDYGIWDKRFFYEQCVGVPLIAAGPGIEAGDRRSGSRISKAMVSHLDLYPTLLDIAGISRQSDHTFWGRSLAPLLRGEIGTHHRFVYAELATSVMIRTAAAKLVFDPEQGGVTHLYNLVRDPRELENLAGAAGYEAISQPLIEQILSHRILLSQYTQSKEEKRLQSVRIY